MAKIKIAILGPGAIGGLLSAIFWKNGYDVVCIDKKENIDFLNAQGLDLKSDFFGNFIARPRFAAKLDFKPDLLFISVKAPFLAEALDLIDKKFIKNLIIVPLLNGLEHMDILKKKYGDTVAAGTIGCVESFSRSPGVIEHVSKGPPCIVLQSIVGIDMAAGILKKSGLDVKVLNEEKQIVWQKLLRLSALSLLTAATGKNLGYVRSDPEWRKILKNFLGEASAVASMDGARLDADAALAELDKLPAGLRSSLQKDIELGRPNELDAIGGAIVRRGKKYGIACPTIENLISKLTLK